MVNESYQKSLFIFLYDYFMYNIDRRGKSEKKYDI